MSNTANMSTTNKTVYIVGGPTCTGKSTVAFFMAKRINGEIVNCDSVQLYKYMDIGSAKPSEKHMAAVPHHLYDFVDPRENFTVAQYQKLAESETNVVFAGRLGAYKYYDMAPCIAAALDMAAAELA